MLRDGIRQCLREGYAQWIGFADTEFFHDAMLVRMQEIKERADTSLTPQAEHGAEDRMAGEPVIDPKTQLVVRLQPVMVTTGFPCIRKGGRGDDAIVAAETAKCGV